MRISIEMQSILDQLVVKQGVTVSRLVDLPSNELGNELIKVYYRTDDLTTRELIRTFLDKAGVVWLRKLLTRDTKPVASSKKRFASLNEYLGLLANVDATTDLMPNA